MQYLICITLLISCLFDVYLPQNSDPSDVIYTSGCIEQGEVWVNQNLIPVAGVFVGLALVQVCDCHNGSLVIDFHLERI